MSINLKNAISSSSSSCSSLTFLHQTLRSKSTSRLRCNTWKKLKDLKSIYCTMIKNNTHQDSYSMNQFLTACSSLAQKDFALLAFNQMTNPNVFVYNALIGGFVQSNQPITALQLYVQMPKSSSSLSPTCYTFSFLIRACRQAGKFVVGFGEAVHGLIVKMGFGFEIILQTGLLDFYSSSERMQETERVFDEIGGQRDVFSWNSMVSAYVRVGHLEQARRTFDEMPEKNTVSWNTMIAGYANYGDVDSAARLFGQMLQKNLISWTSMISCYAQNKQFSKAIETFEQMKAAGVTPDQVTVTTVVASCAHLGALRVGQKVHHYAMLNGFALDVYIGSALIDMYAKCGSIERSLVVFFKLGEKNLFCWNSIIDGLAIHGRCREALDMFSRMKKEGRIEPNWVSFVSVLNACSHSGFVDEGRNMFSSMIKDYSIAPRMEHYCSMVDLLSRAGLLDEALHLVKNMNMEPNSVIWGALLSGCKIHGNFVIGRVAVKKLLDLEPQRSSNYVLLVNMHAEAKRWKEAATVRGLMKDNGVQKTAPGCSWIEIDEGVHEFAASDTSHPSFNEIHLLLVKFVGQLKLAGHVTELSSLS